MKNIILILLVLSLTSCKTDDSIEGYFYDTRTPNIYLFNDNEIILYDLLDSINTHFNYSNSKNLLQIDNEKYNFQKADDSIVIQEFSKDRKDLCLKEFSFETINSRDIDTTYWSMIQRGYSREYDEYFNEEQLLKVYSNKRIKAYFIQDKNEDTIHGGSYDYVGKVYNKFLLYKSDLTTIIILEHDDSQIKILLNSGEKTGTYTLKKRG
ncbi:hypothetical protein A9Q86_01475 [Flavobacteriales bacterium 33_180_T64]|nr:hypothetical protein A9Q86_01475 [Flavobacteriales bacterium 33_180_T64]